MFLFCSSFAAECHQPGSPKSKKPPPTVRMAMAFRIVIRLILTELADVHETSRDCSGSGHCRRDKVRTALEALTALEVTVRG